MFTVDLKEDQLRFVEIVRSLHVDVPALELALLRGPICDEDAIRYTVHLFQKHGLNELAGVVSRFPRFEGEPLCVRLEDIIAFPRWDVQFEGLEIFARQLDVIEFGDEEFCVLFAETSIEDALQVAGFNVPNAKILARHLRAVNRIPSSYFGMLAPTLGLKAYPSCDLASHNVDVPAWVRELLPFKGLGAPMLEVPYGYAAF